MVSGQWEGEVAVGQGSFLPRTAVEMGVSLSALRICSAAAVALGSSGMA